MPLSSNAHAKASPSASIRAERPDGAAVEEVLGNAPDAVAAVLRFAAEEVVPRLDRTTDELDAVLHALSGGYVPAGPSGSPLRGLVNVLPTGRNFYSVDPRAIPSRLAWETGSAMADGQSYPTGGDVITAVDDSAIADGADLQSAIDAKRPGETVSITYTRDGTSTTIEVSLGTRPS